MRDFFVGQSASVKRIATRDIVDEIARVSQDQNPVHLDESYAANTRFKHCIAHGLFCTGMISALLANELPGNGTILLKQEIVYKNPVYIGDEITASVEILHIEPDRARIKLKTKCKNQMGTTVLDGFVYVMVE